MTASRRTQRLQHSIMLVTFVFLCVPLGIRLRSDSINPYWNDVIVGSRKLSIPDEELISSTVNDEEIKKIRILHVVTSLAEFNDGSRNIEHGSDRLVETLIPTLSASIVSMIDKGSSKNWEIDVYLVLGYVLKPERKQLIVDALPKMVGLEVWDDAIPLYYEKGEEKRIKPIPRALARQHRYVIKDKFNYYDLFSCWEDDMRITFDHIDNFLKMNTELERMIENSPDNSIDNNEIEGILSKTQLENVIPGFIRVEVLQGDAEAQREIDKDPIQILDGIEIESKYCCYDSTYQAPVSDKIILWETAIAALGVRKFPDEIGWIGMLPGSKLQGPQKISTYWSGSDGAFGDMSRPGGDGNYFANAAGFILTKKHFDHLTKACPGNFLPPFVDSMWRGHSGLKPQNVEFWSGGYQLFGRCGLQRILSLDPDRFSKHLIYHTANNKQRQISRHRLVKVNDFIGQLHRVKQAAIARQDSS